MEKHLQKMTSCNIVSLFLFKMVFVLAVALLLALPSLAQQKTNKLNTRFWLDTGIGVAAAGGGPETDMGGGLSLRAAGHLQIDNIVITVPMTINSGGKSTIENFFGGQMRDEFFDAGLLLGYAIGSEQDMQLVTSVGISRVGGSRVMKNTDECWFFCSDGTMDSFDAVMGVPIEIGFYTLGERAFGMGFIFHINFNPEETFAGFSLNLMIGDRN
ncbi:MAG: hypothetical protein ACNS64_08020 [Candidatus Halalkalibacterium sp. M3_1C_030]